MLMESEQFELMIRRLGVSESHQRKVADQRRKGNQELEIPCRNVELRKWHMANPSSLDELDVMTDLLP